MKNNTKAIIAASAGFAALIATGVALGPAASADTTTPSTPSVNAPRVTGDPTQNNGTTDRHSMDRDGDGDRGHHGSRGGHDSNNARGDKGAPSIFAELGITKEQAAKIKAALDADRDAHHADMEANRDKAIATVLAGLVTDGTLTQEQADQITQGDGPRAIHDMIESGDLTKAQAEAIHTAFEANRPTHNPADENIAKVFASLVADGTLTQDQADKLLADFQSHRQNSPHGGPRGTNGHGPDHDGQIPGAPGDAPSTSDASTPPTGAPSQEDPTAL